MKIALGAILLAISISAHAAKDVYGTAVNFVYQLDGAATEFEFSSSTPHGCGGSTYKVISTDDVIANRKFSIVLSAFMSDKKLDFHDTEVCQGNRSVVAWVRIVN